MRINALIPVKGFAEGKSRLTPPLTQDDRATLIVAMLRHVVAVAQAAEAVRRVIVISPDAAVLTLARDLGAIPLRQESTGLNPALDEARTAAVRDGAEAILVLHADLPSLRVDDIAGMARVLPASPAAVFAPDHTGRGTNAALIAPPDALPFLFGPDSFAHHRAAADARGISVAIYRAAGIAGDVDTPDDVGRLAAGSRQ